MSAIESILLVNDENLFHMVFEDACSLLYISLSMRSMDSADEAEKHFKQIYEEDTRRPDVVFVDLNLIGSSFDGIELVRKINYEYGDGVVIGIISSSSDQAEMAKALKAGAQFWMVKTDDIEPRLEEFKKDIEGFRNRTNEFKVYK